MVKSKSKKKVNLTPAIFAIIILIIVASLIFTFTQYKSEVILKGVHVGGIDLSGYTIDEAENAIRSRLAETADEEIKIVAESDSFSAVYSDFGASYDCRLSAEEAYAYGHESFSSAILPAIKSLFGVNKEAELKVHINDRIFDETMASFTDYDKSVEASYELTESSIIVTNGKSGYTINPVTAKNILTAAMKNLDFSTITFEKENISPIPLDVEVLAEKHSGEAVSATYYRDADGSIKITQGNDKIELDINSAKEIVATHTTPGETYEIPAKVTFAKYTSDELVDALFRDVLSSYKTGFASSNANRSHNVALAASSINDKILLPGESLSYNEALGRRTPEAGYKLAGAYSNGATVQEYGGGICQISSTLYNAVLLANLKIDSRTCHMFPVAYVPIGLDATVDYGTIDFVFSNDTDFPIKVKCYTTANKQAICEIIGTKTENFTVTMETTNYVTIPFNTTTEEDPTLPMGEEEVVKKGSNGSKCTTYRVVSVDGQVVSRTKESQSYYIPTHEVKRVGTMPLEEIPESTDEAVSEETTDEPVSDSEAEPATEPVEESPAPSEEVIVAEEPSAAQQEESDVVYIEEPLVEDTVIEEI